MFGNMSSIWKGVHPFVKIIYNMSANRSSVYLLNQFLDIYWTTFWGSNELFFCRVFVELTLKGGKYEVYILRLIAIKINRIRWLQAQQFIGPRPIWFPNYRIWRKENIIVNYFPIYSIFVARCYFYWDFYLCL